MVYDYSQRFLTSVDVFAVSRNFRPEETNIQSTVTFRISGAGGQQHGPSVSVQCAIPDAPEMTLREIEGEFLTAALAIVRRVAEHPPVDLPLALEQTRARSILPGSS